MEKKQVDLQAIEKKEIEQDKRYTGSFQTVVTPVLIALSIIGLLALIVIVSSYTTGLTNLLAIPSIMVGGVALMILMFTAIDKYHIKQKNKWANERIAINSASMNR